MEVKTFYSLINEHVIEVPIIQREYAQGRTSARVTTIRKRFVKDLVNCVKTNESIHLGFIYGKIEGKDKQRRKQLNFDAVSSILQAVKVYADTLELQIDPNVKESNGELIQNTQLKFIPLDGQQRLTTLYLLYWYLYLKEAQVSKNYWIHNFNYTNRKSTMDFLKVINDSANFKAIRDRKGESVNIKSAIKESSFYLQKWNKDKTVVGMLEMLQAIEYELNEDKDFCIEKLVLEDLQFQFDFMDLDALNQTNELYVKMNSRGKQLTNYEHFKSWLQNQHSESDDNEWFDEFWRNLDNKWLNFFWQKIDADFNRLDDFYFNFLKNLALMHSIASNPNIPLESFKKLIELVRNDKTYNSNNVAYISFDKFYLQWIEEKVEGEIILKEEKEFFIFNKETLKFIEKSFNTLINADSNPENYSYLDNVLCKPFFDKPITSLFFDTAEFTPSQPDTILYYAYVSLLNRHDNKSNDDLREWLRFNRNLIYNTLIQGYEDFYKALQQVSYLISHFDNFNQDLLNDLVQNSFFDTSQFREEKLKAKLINSEETWYNPIINAENQHYFQGQIKFLIDFSKVDDDDDDNFDLHLFSKYSEGASNLFSKKIRLSDKFVLQGAMLYQGDYLPRYKSNYLFCIGNAGGLRTRNENWRLFFKGGKTNLLKELINNLNGEKITEKVLSKYIKQHLKTINYDEWNWKNLFLKYPEAISYCNQGFIKWYSENDIRLLPKTNVGGNHAELRSYCFYLDHKTSDDQIKSVFSPFLKFAYSYRQNSDAHPGCFLDGLVYNHKSYRLDIKYSKKGEKFELYFFHKTEEITDRNTDEKIVQILENQKFVFDTNHRHFFKGVDYTQAFREVQSLCSELKIKL